MSSLATLGKFTRERGRVVNRSTGPASGSARRLPSGGSGTCARSAASGALGRYSARLRGTARSARTPRPTPRSNAHREPTLPGSPSGPRTPPCMTRDSPKRPRCGTFCTCSPLPCPAILRTGSGSGGAASGGTVSVPSRSPRSALRRATATWGRTGRYGRSRRSPRRRSQRSSPPGRSR